MPNPAAASDALWFLDTRVVVRLSASAGTDGITVIEHRAPFADSPPLHLHRSEDEVFHILEGTMRFRLGEAEATGQAGDTLLVPKGVVHSYCVESPDGARFLTVTCGGDFERFVGALARPARGPGLPEPAGPPAAEDAEALGAVAQAHGIELAGPPLAPVSRGGGEPSQ